MLYTVGLVALPGLFVLYELLCTFHSVLHEPLSHVAIP